jgi:hypothetical protein
LVNVYQTFSTRLVPPVEEGAALFDPLDTNHGQLSHADPKLPSLWETGADPSGIFWQKTSVPCLLAGVVLGAKMLSKPGGMFSPRGFSRPQRTSGI